MSATTVGRHANPAAHDRRRWYGLPWRRKHASATPDGAELAAAAAVPMPVEIPPAFSGASLTGLPETPSMLDKRVPGQTLLKLPAPPRSYVPVPAEVLEVVRDGLAALPSGLETASDAGPEQDTTPAAEHDVTAPPAGAWLAIRSGDERETVLSHEPLSMPEFAGTISRDGVPRWAGVYLSDPADLGNETFGRFAIDGTRKFWAAVIEAATEAMNALPEDPPDTDQAVEIGQAGGEK